MGDDGKGKSGGKRTGKNRSGKHTGAGELPGRSAMPGLTVSMKGGPKTKIQ
jgi:hypothetical protein